MPHRNASRRLKIALVAALALGWSFVVVDTIRPLPPILPKLKGVTTPPPPPEWTLAALRSGATTRAIGTWFDTHIGLRSFWVRLDNQINYSLFAQLEKRGEGSQLVNGPAGWLYEKQYIDYATTKSALTDEEIARRIERMRRVEQKLARRGIPLIYVVAPSKAEVYPEHIPAKLISANPPHRTITGYEKAQSRLRDSGISYIDGPALFSRWKQEGVPDLFARSGTHWSYASALRIWEEIRTRMNPRLARPIPAFATIPTNPAPPQTNDRDLLDLANLLWPWPYEYPLIKPTLKPQTEIPADRLPRLLWVHDSFGWGLIEQIYEAKGARPADSLYYFRTRMKIPGGTVDDSKIEDIDWPKLLGEYDGIVQVWTEIAFDFDGCGFYETLDRVLD